MERQKLKQYLRNKGCIIESHSQDETFKKAGSFILGKWDNTAFVIESMAGGKLVLRVKQCVGWHPYSPPCRACSQFMGVEVPTEMGIQAISAERCFMWQATDA